MLSVCGYRPIVPIAVDASPDGWFISSGDLISEHIGFPPFR
jgi:hypothetical protein